MSAPTQLLRSKYRTLGGGCVSCSGDLSPVEALPGVHVCDQLFVGRLTPWPPASCWSTTTVL